MTEKITRAQAAAAIREIDDASQELDEIGGWTGDPRVHRLCGFTAKRVEIVHSYLAQQPTEDVVRKAHQDLRILKRHALDGQCQPNAADGREAGILAALPPLPEEK